MKWITSTGGPLILIGKNSKNFWHGITTDNGDIVDYNLHPQSRPKTDYDTASQIDSWIAKLNIGESENLILNEEPLETAWVPAASENIWYIIRSRWHERLLGDFASLKNLLDLPRKYVEDDILWLADNSKYFIFDSSYPGQEVPDDETIEFSIKIGNYLVSTFEVDSKKDKLNVVVHKFNLV